MTWPTVTGPESVAAAWYTPSWAVDCDVDDAACDAPAAGCPRATAKAARSAPATATDLRTLGADIRRVLIRPLSPGQSPDASVTRRARTTRRPVSEVAGAGPGPRSPRAPSRRRSR